MKQKFWSRMVSFIAALAASTLWLQFVIDIWENGMAFRLPYEVFRSIPVGNSQYIISAGLPVAAFCLTVAIPRTLKNLFPRYTAWKKWYICAAGLLLAALTVCMLPVSRSLKPLVSPFLSLQIMEKMIICYARTIMPALVICVICWLICAIVEMNRSSVPIVQTARQNAMHLVCSLAIVFLFTVASLLILNVLASFHVVSKGWINSFCKHNASNRIAAQVSVICAPIVEEIAFRGMICKGLGKHRHRWPAILISAVYFGLWHRNMTQFAYTFVWGIIFGYIVLNTGTIFWPMLMHALSNLLVILAYSDSPNMVFGAWPVLVAFREWLGDLSVVFSAVLLIIIAAVLVILVRCFRVSTEQTPKKSAHAVTNG